MATPQPLNFAQVLRRARLTAGLTQEMLAERAGLAVRSISDLERGLRRAPYKSTIALLAEALHLGEAERATFEAAANGHAPSALPQSSLSAPATQPMSAHPLFVGRKQELDRLARHLAGDGGPLLLLAGEPGIGKSRLLGETITRARAAGWIVMDGGCMRRSGQEIYAPLVGALARAVARLPVKQLRTVLQGCAWLVRLLPELVERAVGPLPTWTLAPEQERRLMFAAVSRFLANSAGPVGTLLVLDDLQWAGQDALDLLESLARSTPEHPLRILGAYRSTEVHPSDPLGLLLADLARDGLAVELAIGPLGDAAAAELAAHLLPPDLEDSDEHEARAQARSRLVARAGGMPFFLVSGARALESGAATEVAWDVSQSIRQRVSLLPAAAREILGAAAVAGRVAPRALLLALTGRAERETLTALKAACQARLLAEAGRADYAFTHDLVREAVEADLTQGQRAVWHRRIAEWMEGLPDHERNRHNGEIAQHFGESDQPGRALPYTLAAGEEAERVYAYRDAAWQYGQAVGLARDLGDQAREADALTYQGRALGFGGAPAEAVAALERAADLYRACGNLDGLTQATVLLVRPRLSVADARHSSLATLLELLRYLAAHTLGPATGDVHDAALSRGIRWERGEQLNELATCAARQLAPWAAAQMEIALATLLHMLLRHREMVAAAKRASAHARAAAHTPLLAQALNLHALGLAMLGQAAAAATVHEASIQLATRVSDLRILYSSLFCLSALQIVLGDFHAAERLCARALRVADQMRDRSATYQAKANLIEAIFFAGRWGEVRAQMAALAGAHDESTAEEGYLFWFAHLFSLVNKDSPEMRARAVGYYDHLLGSADIQAHEYASWVLAEYHLVERRPERALAIAEGYLTRCGQGTISMARLLPFQAWAYLERGDERRARASVDRALAQTKRQHTRLFRVDALRVRAMMAVRYGQLDEAASVLDQTLTLCLMMPYPYAEAKALYVYGQLYAIQGEPERARERYVAALAILNRLGERLYSEQVERALTELATLEPSTLHIAHTTRSD